MNEWINNIDLGVHFKLYNFINFIGINSEEAKTTQIDGTCLWYYAWQRYIIPIFNILFLNAPLVQVYVFGYMLISVYNIFQKYISGILINGVFLDKCQNIYKINK